MSGRSREYRTYLEERAGGELPVDNMMDLVWRYNDFGWLNADISREEAMSFLNDLVMENHLYDKNLPRYQRTEVERVRSAPDSMGPLLDIKLDFDKPGSRRTHWNPENWHDRFMLETLSEELGHLKGDTLWAVKEPLSEENFTKELGQAYHSGAYENAAVLLSAFFESYVTHSLRHKLEKKDVEERLQGLMDSDDFGSVLRADEQTLSSIEPITTLTSDYYATLDLANNLVDEVNNELAEEYGDLHLLALLSPGGNETNFAFRATMAQKEGIITPREYREIEKIRSYRNNFVKEFEPLDISQKDIAPAIRLYEALSEQHIDQSIIWPNEHRWDNEHDMADFKDPSLSEPLQSYHAAVTSAYESGSEGMATILMHQVFESWVTEELKEHYQELNPHASTKWIDRQKTEDMYDHARSVAGANEGPFVTLETRYNPEDVYRIVNDVYQGRRKYAHDLRAFTHKDSPNGTQTPEMDIDEVYDLYTDVVKEV